MCDIVVQVFGVVVGVLLGLGGTYSLASLSNGLSKRLSVSFDAVFISMQLASVALSLLLVYVLCLL